MAEFGFPFAGSGPIVARPVDFTPEDSKERYCSILVGYLGGQLKVSCTPEQLQDPAIREGNEIDFVGLIQQKGAGTRIVLRKVGPIGTIHKPRS